MNASLARGAMIAAIIAASVYIARTTLALDAGVIATHFDASGQADGFEGRSSYLAFMLLMTIGLPLLCYALPVALKGESVHLLSIPNRAFWLAPERRAETLQVMRTMLAWLGVLTVVMVTAAHALILHANAKQPPHLGWEPFTACMAAFCVLLAPWLVVLYWRFRLPRDA